MSQNAEILKTARQATLISSLVAITIGLGTTFQAPGSVSRALDEVRYAQEIVGIWNLEVAGKSVDSTPGFHRAAPPYTPESTSSARIEVAEKEGEKASSKIAVCIVEGLIAPGPALLVNQDAFDVPGFDLDLTGVAARLQRDPGPQLEESATSIRKRWPSIISAENDSLSIQEFSAFWNRLANANVAYVEEFAVADAIVGYDGFIENFGSYDFLLKTLKVEPLSVTRKELVFDGDNGEPLKKKRGQSVDTFRLYQRHDCSDEEFDPAYFNNGTQDGPDFFAEIPVKYRVRKIDWTLKWARFARNNNIVMGNGRLPHGNFEKAFPDLYKQTQSIEETSMSRVAEWLISRRDDEAESINVSGISAPMEILQKAGICIILAFQFYSWAHIQTSKQRLAMSRNGDPGAALAWIVLYDPPWSWVAAAALAFAPAIAAFAVMYTVYWPIELTAIAVINGVSVVVVTVISLLTLVNLVVLGKIANRKNRGCDL